MQQLTDESADRLIAAATEARGNAHAPYSRFAVGAAVTDGENRVFAGCNVENASFGLTVCAERHAVGAAITAGAHVLTGLAVVTDTSPPASPCGACRQVLAEFGDFPVILANPAGERIMTSVSELLPNAFTPESLVKSQE